MNLTREDLLKMFKCEKRAQENKDKPKIDWGFLVLSILVFGSILAVLLG